MDHEIPHYYLANHLCSSPLDSNSNHMLWTLWILGLFLGMGMKSCACVCAVCGQTSTTALERTMLSSLLFCLPALAINLFSSVALWQSRYIKSPKPLPSLIQACFIDSSMPSHQSKKYSFFPFLTKHLFDKRAVQPAALQLETSSMERENFDLGKQWNGKHSKWHLQQR